MKKLFYASMLMLLAVACGKSPESGIDVLGQWVEIIEQDGQEVEDKTSFFVFYDVDGQMLYERRYHNAGTSETGTYACSNDTKENYGDRAHKRVTLVSEANEKSFVDIVEDEGKYTFVIYERMKTEPQILTFKKVPGTEEQAKQ